MYDDDVDAGAVGEWSRLAAAEAGISSVVSLPRTHLSGV